MQGVRDRGGEVSQIVMMGGDRSKAWPDVAPAHGEAVSFEPTSAVDFLAQDVPLGEPASEAPVADAPAAEAADYQDQRRNRRLPFEFRQRMAPMYGTEMPGPEEFTEVFCRDISRGGISFYAEEEPRHPTIMFELGTYPNKRFLVAKVVHITPTEADAKAKYVVGCQFVGRVHRGTPPGPADSSR